MLLDRKYCKEMDLGPYSIPNANSRGEYYPSQIKETTHPLKERCGTLHTPLTPTPRDGQLVHGQFNIRAQHQEMKIGISPALIPCENKEENIIELSTLYHYIEPYL